MRAVARISVSPVKGFRLAHPEHVVYGQVVEPGRVRVGDAVEPLA